LESIPKTMGRPFDISALSVIQSEVSLFNVRGVGDRDKFLLIVKPAQYSNTDLIVITDSHLMSPTVWYLRRRPIEALR
jgi:hypothetical protein